MNLINTSFTTGTLTGSTSQHIAVTFESASYAGVIPFLVSAAGISNLSAGNGALYDPLYVAKSMGGSTCWIFLSCVLYGSWSFIKSWIKSPYKYI